MSEIITRSTKIRITTYDIDGRAEGIIKIIKKYQNFIPQWVNFIGIKSDSSVDYCQINLMRNNNNIVLEVSPNWIVEERDIVHELVHAFFANQDIFFAHSILPLLDKNIRQVISDLYEKQVEQDTENIAEMLLELFKEN